MVLIVLLVLVLFIIVFGICSLDVIEYYCGMVLVIVFELLVKFIVFFVVGIFVIFGFYDGFVDFFFQVCVVLQLVDYWEEIVYWLVMLLQIGVVMIVIMCLLW